MHSACKPRPNSRAPVRLALPALLLMLVAGTALASDLDEAAPAGGFFKNAIRQIAADCAGDALRLCQGVQPGGGRMIVCLEARRDAVSPTCRSHLDKAAAAREASATCSADAAHLCPGVPPGGGRVVACLYGSRDRLTPACRSSLEQATSRLQH